MVNLIARIQKGTHAWFGLVWSAVRCGRVMASIRFIFQSFLPITSTAHQSPMSSSGPMRSLGSELRIVSLDDSLRKSSVIRRSRGSFCPSEINLVLIRYRLSANNRSCLTNPAMSTPPNCLQNLNLSDFNSMRLVAFCVSSQLLPCTM